MRRLGEFPSKKDLVYQEMHEAILDGRLHPGTRLVVQDLAAQLGVSQIPVREALERLRGDGFVVGERYVGARVAPIHAGAISEVFTALEALEIISGRAACRELSAADLDELEAMLREMDTLVDDLQRWSDDNVRLHEFLCDRAKTPLVKILLSRALDHWNRLRCHFLNDVFAHRVGVAQRQHWSLLEALRARDAETVEEIIREHNRQSLASYIAHLRETNHLDGQFDAPVP